MNRKTLLAIILAVMSFNVAADSRIKVELPDMMREHMMSNMRDHLLALETITRYLANHQYDDAADVAEQRLGMSSLTLHGAEHLGKFMPQKMGQIGTAMHHAASRFAVAARDAELEGGLNKAFAALSQVMQQCVACHSTYRVH